MEPEVTVPPAPPAPAAEPTDDTTVAPAASPAPVAAGSASDPAGEPAATPSPLAGKGTRPRGPRGKKAIPSDEPLAVVRYGGIKRVALFRHNLPAPPPRGRRVVVRTERGVELGEVVTAICDSDPTDRPGCMSCKRFAELIASGGVNLRLHRQSKILRMASPQDVNDQVHLDRTGREKLLYSRQQAAELKLKMRMVDVEHLLGGERIVFYFTAETRVDFRELVRRLAGQYRTRIEMRQVGARDEARLVGDYERCGQRCCCQQFLGDLLPVSIRMAKTQKATLDPSKISGRCGRLMCCLRYEDATYEDLRKRLPRKNTWVRTAEQTVRVLSTQILTQLIKVADAAGKITTIENEEIIERDVSPPPPPAPPKPPPARRSRQRPARAAEPDRAAKPPEAEAKAKAPGETTPAASAPPVAGKGGPDAGGEKSSPGSRRRRRRRGGKSSQAPGQSAGSPEPAAGKDSAAGKGSAEGKSSDDRSGPPRRRGRKRKRPRRRRGKGGGDQGGGGQNSPGGPAAS